MFGSDRMGGRPARIPGSIGWGVGLALVTAAISGLSIYLNAFAVKQLPDATLFTTLKNGVAAALLIGLALAAGGRADVRSLDRRGWIGLAVIGIVGGSVPFVLFFSGLAIASAPSAAFIQKTLFIWVALLAVPLLGERLGWIQVAALGVLLAGQAIVASPKSVAWGSGETMIAAATLLWSVEAVLAKRLLRDVPPTILGAGRMGIGLAVLVGYLAVTGRIGAVATLGASQWTWVLVTGLLLAGYVATWFAALRRAPASTVTSVLVGGAIITAALSAAQKGALPQPALVGGYVLMTLAVGVLAVAAVRVGRHRAPESAAA